MLPWKQDGAQLNKQNNNALGLNLHFANNF